MPRPIIIIGASAGGLDAVMNVIKRLPLKFNAPIFVVIHTSPEGPGRLSAILHRTGPLPARTAQQGEPIHAGHIYVAPPDLHLVVTRNRIRLTSGPREHRFRPAIDTLFRSAAEHYGAGVIGIVLSGNMGDGTHGSAQMRCGHCCSRCHLASRA